MDFCEGTILILTFLVLNLPVYTSLDRYFFNGLKPFIRLSIALLYWLAAILAQELVPFIGVLILLFKVHGRTEEELTNRAINIWQLSFRDSIFVAFAALLFKLFITQINRLYGLILEMYLGLEPKPQEIVEEFAGGQFDYKILLFLLVVVLAPIVEEYIFRYYIYDKLLLPRMPAIAAAIIASSLFTLLHLNVSGIPTFFGLGLYCTFVYEKKGFYGAVLTHLVSNLVTAAMLM